MDSYDDIRRAGCAGCVIFSWQDEWFKRTWNTMANVDLSKRHTGVIFRRTSSFRPDGLDPGEKGVCAIRTETLGEWTQDDLLMDNGNLRLYMKYDEKFLYFRVHKDNFDPENEKNLYSHRCNSEIGQLLCKRGRM